jgi:glutaredoxin
LHQCNKQRRISAHLIILPRTMNVVIYTRDGCHLCEDAEALLRAHGLDPMLVDVDADAALHEQFNACVPVVEIDGKIRFRGRVEPLLLRRLLQAIDGKTS